MNLQDTHCKLLNKIGIKANEINALWINLEKTYSSKSRKYHNLIHLKEMIDLFENYQLELQFPNEVLYSIFYHDFIYKATRKDNELKSAEYALSILPEKTILDKQLVFDMIVATQLHEHNAIEDINWLIDFDLKILSKDWEAYQIYCDQIRKEYKIYPDFLYKPGRKKALEHFLEQEYIYKTVVFRKLFDEKAKSNIKREIILLEN
jgi:predicted metal-dependent HD superfamily phosphohydrolase